LNKETQKDFAQRRKEEKKAKNRQRASEYFALSSFLCVFARNSPVSLSRGNT
jgi:hypothetical protein